MNSLRLVLSLSLTLAALVGCGGHGESAPVTSAVGKSEIMVDVTGMT
ncbi:MAG TPA: hypothetical protein PKA37_06750 [Planctomycetota bacterium]|nr:hypothetical protein [Planctomycetota bacterium]